MIFGTKKIDQRVVRTKNRPLAANKIGIKTAYSILFFLILCSFLLTLSLPQPGRNLSISLAFFALPIILIYPSAKRWFKYPQLILSICWGFAVLIPWAANEGNLNSIVLLYCWLATIFWTFGFDTIYALADKKYDIKIGINSSAVNLQNNTRITIQICYFLTSFFLALCGFINQMNIIFWPIWLTTSILMQRDILKVFPEEKQSIKKYWESLQKSINLWRSPFIRNYYCLINSKYGFKIKKRGSNRYFSSGLLY